MDGWTGGWVRGPLPRACTPPADFFRAPSLDSFPIFSMFDKLKEMHAQSPRPIFVTGHSLGAALATIAAARIAVNHDLPLSALYTVGSPRCARAALGVRPPPVACFSRREGANSFCFSSPRVPPGKGGDETRSRSLRGREEAGGGCPAASLLV